MGYRFVRFRGGCPFFQIMIPVQCYTKHIQTPFINKEKDFGSSPGNAHCENSAKVLMWWPPRNGEIWAPMICKRKTLVDFLISCAFGMNFLSKCKKKTSPHLEGKRRSKPEEDLYFNEFSWSSLLSALVLYQKENVATPPVLGSKGDVRTLGRIP